MSSSGKCSLEVSRLIAEVNRRPELWDRQHPQHHNRSVLDHHWECVAASLDITGKAARGKWKNLKDHFRKEYKRCMSSANADQEASKWPYFYSMMFIREQISHTATDASAVYLSDFRYGRNVYNPEPEVSVVQGGGRGGDSPPVDQNCGDNCGGDYVEYDDDDGYRPLNCLHVEYGNNNRHADDQDENISYSEDKHFLLSLVPIFSTLSPDKKLKARIAIETSLLNIAYPVLDGRTSPSHRVVGRNGTLQKQASPTTPNTNTTPATAVDNTVVKTEYDTNTTPFTTTTLNTTSDTPTTPNETSTLNTNSVTAVDNTVVKTDYDTNTTPCTTTTLNTTSDTPTTPNTTATLNSNSDTVVATTTATCTVVKAEYKEHVESRKSEDDQMYQRPQKKARKCY